MIESISKYIIVVLFNPSEQTLFFWKRVAKYQNVILVDNSDYLCIKSKYHKNFYHIYHNANQGGIAGALNYALSFVYDIDKNSWCFLFDQDTRPELDYFDLMSERLNLTEHIDICLLSPCYYENNLEKISDVIQIRNDKLARLNYESISKQEFILSSYSITSGSLLNTAIWKKLDGYDELLFLDFVDIEFGLKANSYGYKIVIIPAIILSHTIGEKPISFRNYKFPNHSPIRHYLYFRNLFLLLRRNYIPSCWKQKELIKLIPRLLIYTCLNRDKLKHLRSMLKGIVDGIFSSASKVNKINAKIARHEKKT